MQLVTRTIRQVTGLNIVDRYAEVNFVGRPRRIGGLQLTRTNSFEAIRFVIDCTKLSPLIFRHLPFGREFGTQRHFRDLILREIEFTAASRLTELRALMQRFLQFNGREQSKTSVGDAYSLPSCVPIYTPGSSIPRAWTRTRSITQVSVRLSGSNLYIYIYILELYGKAVARSCSIFPRDTFYFPNVLRHLSEMHSPRSLLMPR